MKRINATVREYGGPFLAEYKATRISDGKYFMEVRYDKKQSRKWVHPKYVEFKEEVEQVFIEKTSELI